MSPASQPLLAIEGPLRIKWAMTKLVLLHRDDTNYDDDLDTRYDFPKQYLKAVESGVGDWAVYYEPVKAGKRGYFAVARILCVEPRSKVPDRFIAIIAPGSFLPFDSEVPRLIGGRVRESALGDDDGNPLKGGMQQRAVRPISEAEFASIVDLGLPPDLEEIEARRYDVNMAGFSEAQTEFERPVIERLTRRAYRDVAFRRKVREAYSFRCAFSGIELRNGGGRPEVQAAHIRPVAEGGSDSVRNGLALSGTIHWMFDRGLVSVDEMGGILVSHNKVPPDVSARLLATDRRLCLPAHRHHWPHPENLRWHREHIFGQNDLGGGVIPSMH